MTAPSVSLRHDEARERAGLLDVTSYDVELDLASSEETFASRTTLRFTSRGGPTFVDVKPRALRSATLNGTALDPTSLDRGRLPSSPTRARTSSSSTRSWRSGRTARACTTTPTRPTGAATSTA
ncbi:hypothetical protein [Nocardioides zeae]